MTSTLRHATAALLLSIALPASATEPVEPPKAYDTAALDRAYRSRLTVQWAGVTANIIAADVLSLYIPGSQEQVLDTLGSEDNVRWAMAGGAAIYQVPLWTMVGTQLLPPKAARWTTVGAAVVTTATVVGLGSDEPHYYVMGASQVLLMTGAVVTAARWGHKKRPLGLTLSGSVTPGRADIALSGRL